MEYIAWLVLFLAAAFTGFCLLIVGTLRKGRWGINLKSVQRIYCLVDGRVLIAEREWINGAGVREARSRYHAPGRCEAIALYLAVQVLHFVVGLRTLPIGLEWQRAV